MPGPAGTGPAIRVFSPPVIMQRRNRYMVDHSALIIAVYDGMPGGTRQTLEYAIRQKVDFVDIHPEGTP